MISRRMMLLGTAGLAAAVTGCSNQTPTAGTSPTAGVSSAGSAGASPSASASPSRTASPSPSRTASPSPSSSPSPTTSPSPTGKPNPKVADTIAENIDVPWGLAFFANGDALVSERNTAKIIRVTAKGKKTTLGEVSGVQAPSGLGEGGLLGLAFAPGDEQTVYAYLTSSSDNRVVRFSIAGGKVGSPKSVLTGIPTSTHHHGGRLLFDADGMLFVSTGDAEVARNAQDKESLAGKILRIRPDGRAAAGNPFDNRTWSYGHRNVQGLAFDADGRLWASEFGDKKSDELNLISKGGNYGWPNVEGASSNADYRAPKTTWSPTSTSSPSGLAIARSTAFVAALQGECLFSIPLDGTDAGKAKALFSGDHGRLRTVAVAPDGALWLTTSNTDGRRSAGSDDDKILRVTL